MIWGMSKNGHDWGIAIDGSKIINYTGKGKIHPIKKINELKLLYGEPDKIIWYENPYLKTLRQIISGQPNPIKRNNINKYLNNLGIKSCWKYVGHHESHAAHYYNSNFKDATIIVFDSIGEFDCTSIWKAIDSTMIKIKSTKYPHSIGLFYSAMTHRIGMIPQKDEGKFDLMSQNSEAHITNILENDFIKTMNPLPKFKINFHRGVKSWGREFSNEEILGSTRKLFEKMITTVLITARKLTDSKNLVLSGGVSFNSAMPRLVGKLWDNLYIPKNPSDSGSAEGAILAYKHNRV